jgi:hypothetical protein
MNTNIDPEEAARALSEVHHRQRRAVDAAMIPGWFWWAIGALVVVLSAGVDSRRPVLVGVAAVVFGIGLAATIVLLVTRIPVQIRNDLVGSVGALMIVGFVLCLVAVTLGVAFTLRAVDVPYPATLASVVCAAGLGFGGPWLTRRLRAVMTSRAVGDR